MALFTSIPVPHPCASTLLAWPYLLILQLAAHKKEAEAAIADMLRDNENMKQVPLRLCTSLGPRYSLGVL